MCSRCGEAYIGAAAGLGSWFLVGVADLPGAGITRGGDSTRQSQRTELCQCVSSQLWACLGALQGQMQPLRCEAAGVVEPALRAAEGLGRWFVGIAVLQQVYRNFQRRRQHSTNPAHRVVPFCEWPALGMPWATVRSNRTSLLVSRCGGACTRGCGRAGQVVCGGCGFAGLWRFPEEEAALDNHSAQSPASV